VSKKKGKSWKERKEKQGDIKGGEDNEKNERKKGRRK